MSKISNKENKFSLHTIDKWDVLVVIISLGSSLFIAMKMGNKSYDDAYITFRYARNIALGYGFVYNIGEHFLGTTTPLFTLLLAELKILFPVDAIPVIAQWLTGVSLFVLATFTYLLGRDDGKPIAGMVSALLVLFNPVFVLVWGGEAIFFLALISVAVYFYFRERELIAAIFIGLAFLTRGEGILLGFVVFAHYLVKHRKLPFRAIFAFFGVVTPWMVYSFITFNTFFPSTLQAKIAQMNSGLWSPFLLTTLDMLRSYVIGSQNFPDVTPQYGYLIIVIFAFVGGISLLVRPKWLWWVISIWIGLYSLGYALLDVPFYHWYSVPLLYGGIVLAGLGGQLIYDSFRERVNIKYNVMSFIIFLFIMYIPLSLGVHAVWNYTTQPISHIQQLYTNTGLWLQKNTPETASVGYFEIGFIGYYSKRRMIDPAGLVNFGTAERVAKRDFKWSYLQYKPDYLIINPVRWYGRLGSIEDEPWFYRAYQEVGTIAEEEYFDAPIVIYKKINNLAIPNP